MNKLTRLPSRCFPIIRNMRLYSGDSPNSAGSIRAAGGTFGKMEAANEEVYFNKQKLEQLADLKSGLTQEITFHEEHIREHEKAIQRHKERVHQIDKRILPNEPFPS